MLPMVIAALIPAVSMNQKRGVSEHSPPLCPSFSHWPGLVTSPSVFSPVFCCHGHCLSLQDHLDCCHSILLLSCLHLPCCCQGFLPYKHRPFMSLPALLPRLSAPVGQRLSSTSSSSSCPSLLLLYLPIPEHAVSSYVLLLSARSVPHPWPLCFTVNPSVSFKAHPSLSHHFRHYCLITFITLPMSFSATWV